MLALFITLPELFITLPALLITLPALLITLPAQLISFFLCSCAYRFQLCLDAFGLFPTGFHGPRFQFCFHPRGFFLCSCAFCLQLCLDAFSQL